MRNGMSVTGRVLGMLLAGMAVVSVAKAEKPAVAIRSYDVRADIVGLTAVTTVEVVYVNYTNAQAEAQLQWNLPPDAAGSDLSLWAGGLRVAGALVPQVQARQIYNEIRNARRDPALLEYHGSGQWSLRVFPIPAGGTQKVQATFHHLLRVEDGWVRYDAPCVSSGTGAEAAECADMTMTIRAPGGIKDVRAINHRVGVFRQGDGTVKAGWREENVSLTPPVGISYQPAGAPPAAASFIGADKNAYFVAVVPKALDPGEASPRNVVVVVDVSASMKGERIELARAASARVLKALRQCDRFSVVTAGPNVGLWKKQLAPSTEANILSAVGYIENAPVDGGTDLAGALRAAASLAGETTPIDLFLISDGKDMIGSPSATEPADGATSKPARQLPANLRVHSMPVAPECPELSELAWRTKGMVLPNAWDKDDALAIADHFVARMRKATCENVKVALKGQAQVRDFVLAASGDAILGGQVVKGGPAVVDVTCMQDGKSFHKELNIDIPEPGKGLDGWGSIDLEPVLAHLRAESMWVDLRDNPNAKPEELEALITWSRQRRVATRATAFLVLEKDEDYKQRGIPHQTVMLESDGTLTARLAAIAPGKQAPMPEAPIPLETAMLARARELRRQGEYARAIECLEEASRAGMGNTEARAEAAILKDILVIRDDARREKQSEVSLESKYETVRWDEMLLPTGATDTVPLSGDNLSRRVAILQDLPAIDTAADKAAKAKLQTSFTGEFVGRELGEVIEHIARATGANIHVNWRAMEAAQITARTPVSLNLKNVPAERALGILLSDLAGDEKKIVHEIDDGVVMITTRTDLAPLMRSYDISDLLEEASDIPNAPRRGTQPSVSSGLFGSGPAFVGPRVDVASLGQSAGESGASDGLAGSASGPIMGSFEPGTWRVGNRTYEIRDMLVATPRFVSEGSGAGHEAPEQDRSTLRDLIMDSTGAENWKERAPDIGRGTLRFSHGRLIVTNSKTVHAKVIQLVNELRASARMRHPGVGGRIAQARDIAEPLFSPDARLMPWVADLVALARAGKLSEFSSVRIEPVGPRKFARIGGVWFDLALTATAEIQIVVSQSGAGAALGKADSGLKACENLGLCVVIAVGEKLALCFDDIGLINPDDPKITALLGALSPAKK